MTVRESEHSEPLPDPSEPVSQGSAHVVCVRLRASLPRSSGAGAQVHAGTASPLIRVSWEGHGHARLIHLSLGSAHSPLEC